MKSSLTVRLLAGILLAATPGGVWGEEFKVGEVAMELSGPEGMVRVDGVNQAFDDAPKRKAPDGGVTLAVFGSADDLAEIKAGRDPRMVSEYAIFAMAPEALVSAAEFGGVITAIEKVQGEMAANAKAAEEEWRKSEGEAAEGVKFDEPKPLGVTGKGEGWVSFGIIVSAEAERDGKKIRTEVLSQNTLMHHGGKILGLRLTADMAGERTVKSVQEAVDSWRSSLVEAE